MSDAFDIANANADPGKYIARTMHLLASSSAERPNKVRIMVYGQSISKQAWWLKVKHDLQNAYPEARLVMENWAIGGFHSTRLVRCAAHDVKLFYPDLIIFQDYGPRDAYEEIIRAMRRETTTEIMIQTDHVGATQDDAWHDEHSYEWLPQLCRDYGLELVTVRRNWKRYLASHDLEPGALLRDQVHLNDAGNDLMAEIIKAHLVYDPAYGEDPQDLVTTLDAGDITVGGNGDLEISATFEGNRIDLVDSGALQAGVRVDGSPPTDLPGSYVAERPWLDRSWPPKVGVPVRIDLGVGDREADDWTMEVTEVSGDGAEVGFNLHSAKHGYDGAGRSTEDFVSNSGRIVIPKSVWFVRESPQFFYMLPAVEVGDEILFAVHSLSRDAVEVESTTDLPITLARGIETGHHSLTLVSPERGLLSVGQLRVYRPPLT